MNIEIVASFTITPPRSGRGTHAPRITSDLPLKKPEPGHPNRSKRRRLKLKGMGVCRNGISHGKATHGGLCRACRAQHRGVSIEEVPEIP